MNKLLLTIFFVVGQSILMAQPSPKDLKAELTERGIQLSWTNPHTTQDSLAGYELEHIKETEKTFSKFSEVKSNSSSILLTSSLIEPYLYYTFRIRAVYNKKGKKIYSNYSNELQTAFYYPLKFEKVQFIDSIVVAEDFNSGVLEASVVVDGKIKVGQMRLYYCGMSEDSTIKNNWKTSIISSDTQEFKVGSLKNGFGSEHGIYYRFELVDRLGKKLQTNTSYAALCFGGKGIYLENISDKGIYSVISIPLILHNAKMRKIFEPLREYERKRWRLFTFLDAENFLEYYDKVGNQNFADWNKNSAYWFTTKEKIELYSGAGRTFNDIKQIPYSFTLQKGWNLIPNPYNYDINIATIKKTPEVSYIWTHDFLDGVKVFVTNPTTLKKHSGIFVYASATNQRISIGSVKCNNCPQAYYTQKGGRGEFDLPFLDTQEESYSIQTFPNPTQDQQQIHFQIDYPQNVSIALYDLVGNKIKDITKQYFSQGQHQIFWQTQDLNNGLYLLRFQNETQTINHKIAIQK